jgi:hypothetical protein
VDSGTLFPTEKPMGGPENGLANLWGREKITKKPTPVVGKKTKWEIPTCTIQASTNVFDWRGKLELLHGDAEDFSIKTLMKATKALFRILTITMALVPQAHAQIYLANAGGGIGEYDAITGAAINANFAGGRTTYGLVLSGNTLYGLYPNGGPVSEYDATTGATINANFIPANGLIGGEGLAISGNSLFLPGPFIVGQYDATTGAAINANFITGLCNDPAGLLVSANNLYVANPSCGTVGKYDATTGVAINANFITGLSGPFGLAVSGNNLFVANGGTTTVGKYDATSGAAINANFITGLSSAPEGIAISGNNLLVAQYATGIVGEYNATTGATINANFITGVSGVTFLVVAPEAGPTINIQKAVYLTSTNLLTGSNYQVQSSTDLVNWTNQGSVFTATTNCWQSTNYWSVTNWNQLFFRLQLAP